MLLDRGADCNQSDKSGQTLVMMACTEGHKEIVEMLLDRQADCNECDEDERGADCDKCDKDGQSPIMMACRQGRTKTVELLLDRGADCNKCDKDDVPDSKSFDVTLMILLMRNLTPMNPPLCGFDKLPSDLETTQAADLARIKHYRNELAHLQNCKVDTAFFTTAWTDITGAIHRLGGQQMKEECEHLKTKQLDQSNQELIIDIKRSNDEIKGLKESIISLKRSHIDLKKSNELLLINHKKVKKSNDLLQEDHVVLKKSHEFLQEDHVDLKKSNEFLQKDHVEVKKSHELLQEDHVEVKKSQELLQKDHVEIKKSHEFLQEDHVDLKKSNEFLQKDHVEVKKSHELLQEEHKEVRKSHELLQEDHKGVKQSHESLKRDHTQVKKSHELLQEKHKEVRKSQECLQEDHKEVKKSFRSLKRSHSDIRKANELLQENHKKVKNSHQILQKEHKEVKESHELLKEGHRKVIKEIEKMSTSQQDTVPWNIRARIEQKLKTWKDNDQMFIKTRAADHILQCIKENSCVTITGSSGVGKTATLRHVAIQMVGEGYDVLMVTEPSEIANYNNPKKKTLYVFDDLCGNYSVEQSDIKKWDPVMEIIQNILDKKQTKILAACRLQVYQDEKFKSLSVFKSCVCNLLSENMRLSKTEKQSLAELYLKTEASEITAYYDLHDCFPLLCKLYSDNPKRDVTDFFSNPFTVYKTEVDKFYEKGYHAKYCILALCVMFNNKLQEEILTKEVNEETRTIIENTFEACRLDRGTSRLVLQDELNYLTNTFIIKEDNVYKTIHGKLFDFLAYFFGQKMISYLIKNADSGLIKERFLICRIDAMDQFITIIPAEYHQMYIQRIITDWSKGKVQDVFSNINMKIPQFRQKFCGYLLKLDKSYQCKLAHTSDFRSLGTKTLFQWFDDNDDNWYDTALLHCCYLGDVSLVKWCCTNGVDVNRCTYINQSPVIIACEYGHTELVNMLLDGGADFYRCDSRGQSPVMKACEHGHKEIVKLLLDRGADCNKCDGRKGQSPVMFACKHGNSEIVNILLERGANFNKCDKSGRSPLMCACEHGHTEIVKMLSDRGADCNKCYESGQSALKRC
ncbi:uncharacterized protein LOC127737213 [Mytilus californianus]|uniref:uncharacterized protein LOC127737213 n=1 Tax=Mytilus californianus TaxID=6549 RepID=UPI002245985D|nr:uncharacterized protein LOC127737213 [Mytilus californianus]